MVKQSIAGSEYVKRAALDLHAGTSTGAACSDAVNFRTLTVKFIVLSFLFCSFVDRQSPKTEDAYVRLGHVLGGACLEKP